MYPILRALVLVIIVQVFDGHMSFEYMDPYRGAPCCVYTLAVCTELAWICMPSGIQIAQYRSCFQALAPNLGIICALKP